MTLYRHARTKDDLFEAIVADACGPSDAGSAQALADVLTRPLRDILRNFAKRFREAVGRSPSDYRLIS